MTNELEKQFFDTFGIEKLLSQRYHTSIYGSIENCIEKAKEWSKETGIRIKNLEIASDESIYFDKVYYPQITDTHYLKLISIMSKELSMVVNLLSEDIQELKSEILDKCIMNYHRHKEAFSTAHREYADDFKHQVRTLFGGND